MPTDAELLGPLYRAAQDCNEATQTIPSIFGPYGPCPPEFTADDRAIHEQIGQRRPELRPAAIDRLVQVADNFSKFAYLPRLLTYSSEDYADPLSLVRRANCHRLPPIEFQSATFSTGHEASAAQTHALLAAVRTAAAKHETEEETERRILQLHIVNLFGRLESEYEAAIRLAEDEGGENNTSGSQAPPKITVWQANEVAKRLATADPDFVHKGIRDWAAAIQKKSGKSCSRGTVEKTDLWCKLMVKTGRGREKGVRQPKPKTVSLEEQKLRQSELERLKKSQDADDADTNYASSHAIGRRAR